MKRHIVTLALAGLCVALAAPLATADVPPLMNYQGVLLNSGGAPVITPVTVVFTIYDTLADGNALWTETRNVTPDAAGLFTINLGEVNPLTNTVFTGPNRWLGIKIGADPELSPRIRLVTVPYAQRAATVDGGGTAGWTDDGTVVRLTDSTDRVGIGTRTPNEQLEITGNLRLPLSTASVGVIKSGGTPFIHNFGIGNTFIGLNAGNLTTFGPMGFNTGCGDGALRSNTTGHDNTACGAGALSSNTTGSTNTACGIYALASNTTGSCNTASGRSALVSNTTGSRNTAYGFDALLRNDSGYNNTASGYDALYENTSGHYNTASGFTALRSNTTGYCNTADGQNALYSNTTGLANTAVGVEALDSNTTGSYNTAIGRSANVSTGNLTNATAIGNGAIVNASNKIRLGDTAVTVLECQVGLTVVSDSNQKENFRPVDGDEVLRKIRALTLTSWNMKGHDPQQFRHYGPVAQEFFAAFGHDGVGTSGTPTTINSGDMAGILMSAVQALEKRTDEVEALKSQVAELREMIRTLASKQK